MARLAQRLFVVAVATLALAPGQLGCRHRASHDRPDAAAAGGGRAGTTSAGKASAPASRRPPRPPRTPLPPLGPDEVYVYASGPSGLGGAGGPGGDSGTTDPTATKMTAAEARAAGLLVVDLSDGWAPYIFQDGGLDQADPAKPNGYRQTFIDLANDRVDADGRKLGGSERNYLEPFGIPPTLSVLLGRVEEDEGQERATCRANVEVKGLRAWTGSVGYLDRDRARRDHTNALRDAEWLDREIVHREQALAQSLQAPDRGGPGGSAGGLATGAAVSAGAGARARATEAGATGAAGPPAPPSPPSPPVATWKPGDRAAALAALSSDTDPKVRARVERALRGQERERAVRATQALLTCDGLLSPRARITPGSFDLTTHEALAAWERKNDVFGWGMLGGETQAGLLRPPLELDYEALRRVAGERVADAAGIVEDGSTAGGRKNPASYADEGGARHPVPNLIEDHVNALLAAMRVADDGDVMGFLRQHGPAGLATLKVAFAAPALPPYYPAPGGDRRMELSAEIDRGDVWYDFPFDAKGRPIEQARTHFPHLTLFAHWHGQRIALVSWRTTIGSWRSEAHANGKVYYRYKNSDVGRRLWKNIVAGPVWIPPDGTPVKDLLIQKVLERNKRPQTVVNTDVMGPGFQSAYGLVMAIHVDRSGFDNQIRTHGSVDYTSIARRFSHGCHRLVNDRAVRLFDFVLRHSTFHRVGAVPLHMKRRFEVDGQPYAYGFATRGYSFELERPVPVDVTEGRVMGAVKKPVTEFVRKAGVDYEDVAEGEDAVELGIGPATRARPPAGAKRRRAAVSAADPSTSDATASARAIGGSRAPSLRGSTDPEPAIGP